jgi:hypothetical protein
MPMLIAQEAHTAGSKKTPSPLPHVPAAAFNPHNPASRCGLVHCAISSLSRRSGDMYYPAAKRRATDEIFFNQATCAAGRQSAAQLMRSFSVTSFKNNL